jgi:hypothetical protein
MPLCSFAIWTVDFLEAVHGGLVDQVALADELERG